MPDRRQAAPPRRYLSGFCGASRRHDLCRGAFRGIGDAVLCDCPCHIPEPPTPPAICDRCGQPLPEVTDA